MRCKLVVPLLMLMTCLTFLGVACGGDGGEGDEVASATDTARLDALEERVSGIEGYIAGQVAAQQNDGADEDSMVKPVYALKRENASENEASIVRWIAECTADSYLNPDLPPEVRDREISKNEEQMWNALAIGQYVSFEQFIGQAYSFCQAVILQEDGR